jgi:hypothetical protein
VSFADRPTLTGWQKLGCLAYALIGVATSALTVPISGTGSLWVFAGTLMLVLLGGIVLLKFFMKEKG